MNSQAKNAAAPLNGRVCGLHLVGKAQGLKPGDDADNFPQTLRLDSAVNLPGRVAYAENLAPWAGTVRIGFFFDQGQNFLIYGEWLYAFDDLRDHGVFPETDIGGMAYVAKYLLKALQGAPA